MARDTILVNYEQLEDVNQRFQEQAEACKEMIRHLQQRVAALENDGWEGGASRAFFKEMNGEVFPALGRLDTALQESGRAARQVAQIFREAEVDTKAHKGSGSERGATSTTVQVRSFNYQGDVITGVSPGLTPQPRPKQPKNSFLDQRWGNIRQDIAAGNTIADRIIINPRDAAKDLASLPENPLSMEMDLSDAKDLFKQAYRSPASGILQLMKVPFSGFIETAISNKAGEVAKARARYYSAYAAGVASVLDPSQRATPPTDEWEREFYDFGTRAVDQLSSLEKYQLSVALVEKNRTWGIRGHNSIPQTRAYVEGRLGASTYQRAIEEGNLWSDARYR